MKVLLVNGSPNAKGTTYTALSEIAKTLEEEGIGAEIYHIGNKPISGCIGCRACVKLGHCCIKDNVNDFVEKAKEFSRKFKLNQELYTKKYKELVGEDDPTNEVNNFMKEEEQNQNDNFLMTDNSKQVLKKRDTELNKLLNSVSDLAGIFKDMQVLVMEQGSILDRIDYNIDVASTNVVKGKNSLIKANDYHKNNCFRNVIIVLLVCIFIEAFMLIFKFIK